MARIWVDIVHYALHDHALEAFVALTFLAKTVVQMSATQPHINRNESIQK